MNKLKKHQNGLSLIELMVALTLSLMIMAGAISILGSNKRVYRDQNEMGRLQENARFALELLNKDIRSTGFTGCADDIDAVQNDITTTATSLLSYTSTNIIEGSENGGTWTPSTGSTPLGVAGTDGITIRTIKPIEVNLSGTSTATLVPATSTSDIATNDAVVVYDCISANIFTATGTTGGLQGVGITNTGYDTSAEIGKFYAIRYYIAVGANGQNALFRYGLFNGVETAQELIPGVDNMQILYGEDTVGSDSIADTYVNAGAVTNWTNVVSVRIALLVNGVDQNFTGNQDINTYSLLGTNVGPYNDYRRRKIFTSTIQIRNRT